MHQLCPKVKLSIAVSPLVRFIKLSRDVSPVGRLHTFVPDHVSVRIHSITERRSLLPTSLSRISIIWPCDLLTGNGSRRDTGLLRSVQKPTESLRSRHNAGASCVREQGSTSPITSHVPFGPSLVSTNLACSRLRRCHGSHVLTI